jgi:hypothetical protein
MKSWRTTIVGALLAAIVAIQPILESGSIDYKKLGLAAVIALFGYLVKDANVTGTN